MQLVLATNNEDKIAEIRDLLDDLSITILTRADFLDFPEPEESGSGLSDNATIKARAIADYCELPALADDSGLEVDALNGAPGVLSSRYAGENVTYKDNYEKLLAELKGVPREKRTARFRCVMAIAWSVDEIETVEGVVEGFIAEDAVVGRGFGYDPVFFYPPLNKHFSEMSAEEKNRVSHRGLALQEVRTLIIDRLNSPMQG